MNWKESNELNYRTSRLSENNITNPHEAIDLFFSNFSLSDCRQHLWELYRGWVMSERSKNGDHADLLFFYMQIEMLAEAAWLIHNKNKNDYKI